MHMNGKRLQNDTSTARTHLASVARVHRNNFDSGLDSLVVEHCAENPKASIVRDAREFSILEHEIKRQILQYDCPIIADKASSNLMPEVFALIGDVFLEPRNFADGLLSVLAAVLLAGDRTLQAPEFGKRSIQGTGTIKEYPVGKRQCVGDTNINANGGVDATRRHWVLPLDLEANIPTRRFANDNDVLEIPIWKCPVPSDTHISDILEVESSALNSRPVAWFESNAVEVIYSPEAWSTALTLHKLSVSTIKAAENLLTGGHIQETQGIICLVFVTPVPPHTCLLVVPDTSATFVPALAAVGQGMVVERAGGIKDIPQGYLVGFVGIETITVSADHHASKNRWPRGLAASCSGTPVPLGPYKNRLRVSPLNKLSISRKENASIHHPC